MIAWSDIVACFRRPTPLPLGEPYVDYCCEEGKRVLVKVNGEVVAIIQDRDNMGRTVQRAAKAWGEMR